MEGAIAVALTTRLDLQNLRQEHEDTARAIKVTASFLRPRLDLIASGRLRQQAGERGPFPRAGHSLATTGTPASMSTLGSTANPNGTLTAAP